MNCLEGATATDLVLTVTEMLRERGVVSKFVEFFGPGLPTLGLADRATLGNMSPEFGSTCAIFPVDAETLRYLDLTAAPTETIELVDAYAREQGMFRRGRRAGPDLLRPARARPRRRRAQHRRPKRPQDRVPLADAKEAFLEAMEEFDPEAGEQLGNGIDEADDESFPASDPPAEDHDDERGRPRPAIDDAAVADAERGSEDAIEVTLEDGTTFELDHGRVVIAAITSCTNTSNPSVMVGAGLLARNAVERGLDPQALGQDLAGAGLDRRHRLPRQGRPDQVPRRAEFNLVGYGCTTCIGNSGPLPAEISAAVEEKDLAVCAVLSGNRNFEGRINQDVKANYLASPPLVVAYALAGRMDLDLTSEPLGEGSDGEPVYLRDIWPDAAEIKELVGRSIASEMFTRNYGEVLEGDETWQRGRGSRGRPLHLARLDLRAPALLLRGDAGRGAGRRADRGRPGAGPARRLDHHRPHLARRARSRRTARPGSG